MLVALLLAAPALAHRPHAVVTALAAHPDFERSGRAWVVFDPSDNAQLLRTDDHGAHWDQVGGAPQGDALVDMGYLGATLVVLAEDGTVWSTEDEGAEWSSFDLEETLPRAMASTAARIAVATADGVYAGENLAPDTWVRSLRGVDVVEVSWSASAEAVLLARASDGALSRSEDGGTTFAALPTVPGSLGSTAVGEGSGVTWAGSVEGVHRLVDGAWQACTVLPASEATARSQWVTELVVDTTGTVFAATADEAFFRSDDGCVSWAAVDTGLDATFGGIGGVSDPDQTYVGMLLGGRWGLLAGFDGLAQSTDGGATWTTVPIVASDWVRGLFVAPNFPKDSRIYFGTYGGGVAWTSDGGASWSGSSVGLAGPFNFALLPLPDFATSNAAWWAGGEPDPPAITRDGGETWTTVDVGFDRAMSVDAAGDHIYVLGAVEGESGGWLTRSADGGETWERMDALHDALGGVYPGAVREAVGTGNLYVATDRPAGVVLSEDGGATWSTLSQWDTEERSTGLELWGATRILHAGYDSGLHVSDDLGRTWESREAPVAHPRFLAQADDGTLFTASGDGQMHRSTDGGDTWEAVGAPIGPTIALVQFVPDFATTGTAFAGTTRGVYWTTNRGDSWHRLPRFQRYAAAGFHLSCVGRCTPWDDGTGGLIDGYDLTELDVVSFSFEGSALRLDAEPLGDALIVLTVDGVEATTDNEAEWLVSGLAEGWHDVTIRVLGGPVRLRAVEALGAGEVYTPPEPDTGGPGDTAADTATDTAPDTAADTGGDTDPGTRPREDRPPRESPPECGCGPGLHPSLAPLLLAAALARRRTRANYLRPSTWITRSSSKR